MRVMKTRGRWAAAVLAANILLVTPALAAEELIPVGEPVGIRLEIAGVLVAGTNEIETENGPAAPAQEAGLRTGDVITAVNGAPVESAEDLAADIGAMEGGDAELTVLRDGRELTLCVEPARTETDGAKLGVWLRDSITGIGTVTYIDPETGSFGALGHGVNDGGSGGLLPAAGGSVCPARITDVTPGAPNAPGELSGSFVLSDEIGAIRGNTEAGLFGVLDRTAFAGRAAVPVAKPGEVRNGEATILACVDGREAREYRVEIARTVLAGTGRDLTVQVTDPALLARTGGIVQGMSGSPILQDGRLVGAVTHVLTGDPTRGYGILAETMLETSDAA